MKVLVALLALVVLAYGHKALLAKRNKQCDPDTETECPAGCCPEGPNWFCCPTSVYCAATEADCMKKTQLVKLAKRNKQCGPDETTCPNGADPGGCCPEANWVCCDEFYCAAIEADCP
jgi:hypothetical protein